MTLVATITFGGPTVLAGSPHFMAVTAQDTPMTEYCFDCGTSAIGPGLIIGFLVILFVMAVPGIFVGVLLHRRFPGWKLHLRLLWVGLSVPLIWATWWTGLELSQGDTLVEAAGISLERHGMLLSATTELAIGALLAIGLSAYDASRVAAQSTGDYFSDH